MAQIKNTKPEELEGFGRRLLLLCRENNLYSPTSLAMVLYKEYYEIVQPGTRNNKHGISVKSAENDVKALTRAVQKHFNIVEAYKVQSHFQMKEIMSERVMRDMTYEEDWIDFWYDDECIAVGFKPLANEVADEITKGLELL